MKRLLEKLKIFINNLIFNLTKKKNLKSSTYSLKKNNLIDNKFTLKTKRGLFGGRINPYDLPKTKNGNKVIDVSYELDDLKHVTYVDKQFVDDDPTCIGPRGGRYRLVKNKYGKVRREYF